MRVDEAKERSQGLYPRSNIRRQVRGERKVLGFNQETRLNTHGRRGGGGTQGLIGCRLWAESAEALRMKEGSAGLRHGKVPACLVPKSPFSSGEQAQEYLKHKLLALPSAILTYLGLPLPP
jgi:hypothetical protein